MPRHLVRRSTGSDGLASVLLPMLLWFATLVTVALIDLTAYLAAAARAQSLADAAALAAVSTEAGLTYTRPPCAEAQRVVDAGDGWLESCVSTPGTAHARASVSLEVPGLVIPRLGASRVTAEAEAVLAPAL